MTFAVILVTLVGQGLTLPAVLRWAGWDGVEFDGDELTLARAAAYQAGLDEIERARPAWPTHQPLFDRLESGLRDRTQHLATEDPGRDRRTPPGAHRARGDPARRHRAPSARAVIELRDRGEINDRDAAPDRARARPRRDPDGGLRPTRPEDRASPSNRKARPSRDGPSSFGRVRLAPNAAVDQLPGSAGGPLFGLHALPGLDPIDVRKSRPSFGIWPQL